MASWYDSKMLSYIQLTHDHALEAGHIAFLGGDLEISVDDRNSQEDTGTRAESSEKVAANRESTDASTTESGGGRDDTLELTVHALLTMTSHDKTLLLQLLSDITRRGTGDFNPGLGKDSAGSQHAIEKVRQCAHIPTVGTLTR
jgi:hypothetical protein